MISLELSTEYHVDENNVSLTQAGGEGVSSDKLIS
jgi:hypothetical protein